MGLPYDQFEKKYEGGITAPNKLESLLSELWIPSYEYNFTTRKNIQDAVPVILWFSSAIGEIFSYGRTLEAVEKEDRKMRNLYGLRSRKVLREDALIRKIISDDSEPLPKYDDELFYFKMKKQGEVVQVRVRTDAENSDQLLLAIREIAMNPS